MPKTVAAELTHLDKIFWPKEGYTKGDLVHYYEKMAPFILPYLKDRPIMLHRFPNGIEKEGFYQKDVKSPSKRIKTIPVDHEGKTIDYLLITDLSSLLYAINLGSIDIHPFLARYQHLNFPDFCVIDLDPVDIAFSYVIETALAIHDLLEEHHVDHYCKTSGSKGLHICIPLHAKYTFEQSRSFAEIIAHYVHQKLPDITSLEREPKKRQKKIYLDCLQNRLGQTLVAPYAVRPLPYASASTPLLWHEVTNNLDIHQFNINTLPDRVTKIGDIFKPVLGKGINMKTALQSLQKTM